MIGAIAGDIIGSVYERQPCKRTDFEPLFDPRACFTDDTVLTVAVADALLHNRDPVDAFKDWGRRHPHAGWGPRFRRWLFSDRRTPTGSYGNGAAMRVSPAAFLARSLDEALALARRTAEVTHDHPEGIRGAAATAAAIFLARRGEPPATIRAEIAARFGYDMNRTVDGIRPRYRFTAASARSVPEALLCALEARNYEEAVRYAVSLGGDADTQAAIAGAVAEGRFGVPDRIAAEAYRRIPPEMQAVVDAFYRRLGQPAPSGPADPHPHADREPGP